MELALGAALILLFFAMRAQLHPFTRCGKCGGRPPSDGKGNYRRCSRCGGSPERLRFGAWVQLKMGIPVPRAKSTGKRHKMSL